MHSHFLTSTYWAHQLDWIVDGAFHSGVRVASILVVYIIVRRVINGAIDAVLGRMQTHESVSGRGREDRVGRVRTIQGLAKSLTSYVLFFVFGALLLKAIGFDIMPFITTAGVIGLAIGFGSQKLIRDMISGFFIIIDDLFVVGDVVTIGAVTGHVEEMGMRVTRVVDTSGKIYQFSNGDIALVTNLSRNIVEETLEVAVVGATELGKARAAAEKACAALYDSEGHNLTQRPELKGITALSAASFTLRFAVYAKPDAFAQEQMRLREALKTAFAEAEIALA